MHIEAANSIILYELVTEAKIAMFMQVRSHFRRPIS